MRTYVGGSTYRYFHYCRHYIPRHRHTVITSPYFYQRAHGGFGAHAPDRTSTESSITRSALPRQPWQPSRRVSQRRSRRLRRLRCQSILDSVSPVAERPGQVVPRPARAGGTLRPPFCWGLQSPVAARPLRRAPADSEEVAGKLWRGKRRCKAGDLPTAQTALSTAYRTQPSPLSLYQLGRLAQAEGECWTPMI